LIRRDHWIVKKHKAIASDFPESIVIVGGGFAGVTLAQRLASLPPVPTEIIVLSAENHLVFSSMLPEVVGRTISPLHVVVAGRELTLRTACLIAARVVAVASLMVYVGSFAVGLGLVFWLILSEIYPLAIRGRAMSVGTVANWGANLIVALSFLTLTQMMGKAATFWLYGAVSIGAWLFAYFLVPETKGKTLEQIEEHWRAGKHPRAL
jgi:hypothetical protein